jgi:hypothetical protein
LRVASLIVQFTAQCVIERGENLEKPMAKATKTRPRGAAWTRAMHVELRKHSKARTPIAKISKQMKRTIGALRQQALKLGIGLGHRR